MFGTRSDHNVTPDPRPPTCSPAGYAFVSHGPLATLSPLKGGVMKHALEKN